MIENSGTIKEKADKYLNWLLKENIFVRNDDGFLSIFASKELQNDKEVILKVVQTYGWSLQFASEELQNDKEVVLKAAQNDGLSLKYASKELQKDKEVVLRAVQNAVHKNQMNSLLF